MPALPCPADRVVTESLAVLSSVAQQRDHFLAVMAVLLDCFRGSAGARLLQVCECVCVARLEFSWLDLVPLLPLCLRGCSIYESASNSTEAPPPPLSACRCSAVVGWSSSSSASGSVACGCVESSPAYCTFGCFCSSAHLRCRAICMLRPRTLAAARSGQARVWTDSAALADAEQC